MNSDCFCNILFHFLHQLTVFFKMTLIAYCYGNIASAVYLFTDFFTFVGIKIKAGMIIGKTETIKEKFYVILKHRLKSLQSIACPHL